MELTDGSASKSVCSFVPPSKCIPCRHSRVYETKNFADSTLYYISQSASPGRPTLVPRRTAPVVRTANRRRTIAAVVVGQIAAHSGRLVAAVVAVLAAVRIRDGAAVVPGLVHIGANGRRAHRRRGGWCRRFRGHGSGFRRSGGGRNGGCGRGLRRRFRGLRRRLAEQ